MAISMSLKKTQKNSKDEVDAFTLHVMSKIEPQVLKSLNLVQLESIRSAISANAPFKRHPVDIRMVLPLFFVRLYCVVLIGSDSRSAQRTLESQRRQTTFRISKHSLLYIALIAMIPTSLAILYVIKSSLGIDIFPNQHLYEIFQ